MKIYLNTEFGPWEKCHIPDCKNGICYALDSEYCYPHTKSKDILDKILGKIKIDKKLKQTIQWGKHG